MQANIPHDRTYHTIEHRSSLNNSALPSRTVVHGVLAKVAVQETQDCGPPSCTPPQCPSPSGKGGTSKKRCHLCHKEHKSIIAKRTTILLNLVNVCFRGTRGLTSAIRKENRAKQVEDPSSAVEAHSLGVSILQTFAKVLTEPGKRYSRGTGIWRRCGKSSPKEGLHSAPPTLRHTCQ